MLKKAASVRGVLIVIALLLVGNLIVNLLPGNGSSLGTPAQAQQQQPVMPLPTANKVNVVQGFSIEDLKEVVPLGDGRTFVVSNANGFMVYQVEAGR